jgi:hypothetical protein
MRICHNLLFQELICHHGISFEREIQKVFERGLPVLFKQLILRKIHRGSSSREAKPIREQKRGRMMSCTQNQCDMLERALGPLYAIVENDGH